MSQVGQMLLDQLREAAIGDPAARYELLAHAVCPNCGDQTIHFTWPSNRSTRELHVRCASCTWTMARNEPGRTSSGQSLRPFANPKVSQAMLIEYLDVQRAERRRKTLRELILDLLENGGQVEPGVLGVDLRPHSAQIPSWAVLEQVLGPAVFAELRRRIPVRTSYQVWLVPGRSDFENAF
jgi:ribosomal protein S27E